VRYGPGATNRSRTTVPRDTLVPDAIARIAPRMHPLDPGTAKQRLAISGDFVSGRQDLNLRPPGPQPERFGYVRRCAVVLSGLSCFELPSLVLTLHPVCTPLVRRVASGTADRRLPPPRGDSAPSAQKRNALRPRAGGSMRGRGGGGIAAALRQMQEPRERRSLADGRLDLVLSRRLRYPSVDAPLNAHRPTTSCSATSIVTMSSTCVAPPVGSASACSAISSTKTSAKLREPDSSTMLPSVFG
jgi:hypothetical protein